MCKLPAFPYNAVLQDEIVKNAKRVKKNISSWYSSFFAFDLTGHIVPQILTSTFTLINNDRRILMEFFPLSYA